MTSLQFNCGEFRPGKEPINIPAIPVATTPVLIPSVPVLVPPWLPDPPIIPPLSTPYIGIPYYQSSGELPIRGVVFSSIEVSSPSRGVTFSGVEQDPLRNATRGVTFSSFEQDPLRNNVINSNVVYSQLQNQTITVQVSNAYLHPLDPRVTTQVGSLYNPKYNLVRYPQDPTTSFVTNYLFENIFGQTISSEVSYFLINHGSQSQWEEKYVFNLTNEKILISLNRELFNALNRIHHIDGVPVNITDFAEAIKKHLLEGTLDWFDSKFFIDLANRQSNDKFVEYRNNGNRFYLEQAALGTIALEALPVDSSRYSSIQRNQLKRQRRLNEELNLKICVTPLDSSSEFLYLSNGGIGTSSISDGCIYTETGDGDGYYIQTQLSNEECLPLPTFNDLSAAYYLPPNTRERSLKIMNEDSSVYLSVSSTDNHEFSSSSIPEYSLEPKYFKINLWSVESRPSRNPLVNRTRISFSLITNQEEINRETLNNGFAVTRANINYDDPFIRYALDSSSIILEQNDIVFDKIQEDRSNNNYAIITRSIPYGIILTPVVGSRHNPFNGNSRIEEFENNIVTRGINMIPSIDYSDSITYISPLDEVNLNGFNGNFRVGVAEDLDGQGYAYVFSSIEKLNDRFYSNGAYTSAAQEVSSYGMSYIITNIIDPLSSNNEITWWDVHSRLSLNRFGELLYDNNNRIYEELSNGLRNNVKIKNIISRLSEPTLIEGDDIILKAENRGTIGS